MSVSSYIKLKKGIGRIPKSRTKTHDSYGDIYPYIRNLLDVTANKLKVESPASFEFIDPEYVKVRKKQKEWHDASVGLVTFTVLLEHFRAGGDTTALERVEPSALLEELENFRIILEVAAKKKDLFRIEVLA